MHLAKQRLINTITNPPLPPFSKGGNFFSTFHKGGLRGIWSILAAVLIFVVICSATTAARAGQAILTWDPPTTNSDGSPLTDLAGYKVYYGPTSGNYSAVIDVANVTGYTVTGLNDNATYYFATTAYNTSSIESVFSSEVSKTTAGSSDITAPVLSNITTGNITSYSAVITWTTDEQSSSQIEYGTTSSYGSSTTLDNTMVSSHTVSISGLSSWTTYHYRVKSRDAAGNLATSGDYTFTTLAPPDTTAPTGTISINSGDTYTTSTSVTLTLSCSDAGSGCSQMRLSNDGTTWNVWENYVTSKTWTLTSGDAVKTVYIQYIDANNNTSQNYTDTITLDATIPTLTGIGTTNLTASSVDINWTSSQDTTTQVEYGTTTGYGYSSALDTNLVSNHSVSLGNLSASTIYHYRVKSRDPAGNLATSGDYTFTTFAPQDTTAPTGTISINSGGSYTTSSSITLTLSCSDTGSGCSQVRLSNDGTTWNVLENFVVSKTWTLSSGDGVKTVSIQFIDSAGNSSQVYSDTITLDTTSPAVSGIGTDNLTSSSITINWTTSEGSNTQVDYGTTTSYGASTALNANSVTSHSVTLSGLSASTLYHYRVKSRDAAGNLSTSGDYTFTTTTPLDTTAPVISNISTGNITSTDATVTWTTDEASTSQVEYGTSSNYGSASSLDSNLATSHTVTLSGLTPNTTYSFRVLSSDQAGNQGTSASSNFTTQNAPQTGKPAAIKDLKVRTGASKRNSVILDWTATGADGTVILSAQKITENGTDGTASAYDLRMSTQKIIEDGITPAHGEINFSAAAKITGMTAPKTAGTPEAVQVELLDTNSVYYFAIKAIDNKGNLSGISTVVNGNAIPPIPVTAVRQGYTMISIPVVPATSNVQTLLGGIVGSPVELYWWSSNGMGENNGEFVAETNIVPGYGYFLKSNSDNAVLNITGTAVSDSNRAIPLQPGWSVIGNPYAGEVALRNTYIRNTDTGALKNYEDAVIAGWVGNAIYNYNGSTYNFSEYTDAILKLWQGYWVAVLQDAQFEIIIYKP